MANSRELAQFASFVNFTGSSIGFSTHFNVSGVSTFTNAVIFDNTGYIQVPAGNTAQRDITGIAVTFGQVRYNTQLSQFEGFGAGDAWGSLGGVKDVDGDTFIRAESAAGEDEDKLEFLTGDTTRVVIDSTGQVGIGTTIPNATLDVTGNINIVGVSTFSDNVEVPSDSKKILLGAEKEMQVFHNGTDSLIKDTRNSGSVKIQADKFAVIDKDASETMLFATVGAAVTLSYGGNTKFETTSTGIKISNGTTATIVGPDEIVIDPATVGDNTGTVRIKGDLFVDGTQTQINSTTLELADFVVGVATTATTDLLTDGAGIGIGSDKTFLYEHNSGTNPSLKSSENLNVASGKVYQIGETERLSTDTLSVGTGATVHSPDSNVLTLGTNSSERIRVDSSGRVLIGTTVEGHTSAQNLTVGNNTSGHSGITIRSSPSYIGSLYFSDATSSPAEYSGFLQYSHNGNFLSLGTDTTEKLRITSDGNVGIGLTNPEDKLHLSASNHGIGDDFTLAKNLIRFEDTDVTQANNQVTGGILFEGHDTDSNAAGLQAAIICNAASSGGNGGSQLRFYTTTGGSTITGSSAERLRIDSSGNLTAVNTSNGGAVTLKIGANATTGVNNGTIIINNGGTGDGALQFDYEDSAARAKIYVYRSTQDLIFDTAGSERLRITSDGSVGIGTNNPSASLQINSASPKIILQDDDNAADISVASIGGAAVYSSASDTIFQTANTGERVRITSGGNIGINTTVSPSKVTIGSVSSPTFDRGAVAIKAMATDSDCGTSGIYIEESSTAAGQGEGYNITVDADGDLNFHNSGAVTPTICFNDNDRIGIGTDAPQAPLHIFGSDDILLEIESTDRYSHIDLTDTSSTARITNDGGTGTLRLRADKDDAVNNSNIQFEIDGAEKVRITSAGDLKRPKSLSQEVSTSVSTTSATDCGNFVLATYRSAYVIAQITQGTSYQVGRYLLIHDGTTVTTVEESAIATGDMLGTFEGVINGDFVEFRVMMGSASSATVITKIESIVV